MFRTFSDTSGDLDLSSYNKDKLSKQDEEELRMFRRIKRTTKPDSGRLDFTFGILGTELAAYLCKVLTGQQDPEQTQETMDNTRDYRVKWLKRMNIRMQNKMFNYLSFLDELINDTLPLIERESEAKVEKNLVKDKLSKQDEEEVRMFRRIKRELKDPYNYFGITFGVAGVNLAGRLCRVLTGQQDPEQTQEVIDSTRDYRVKRLKRMPIPMQNKMFNYLSFLDELIYDTFPLIERESEAREFKDKLSEP